MKTPSAESVKKALKIEDDHYCGRRPINVRLATVISQALDEAWEEGFNDGVEEAAKEIDKYGNDRCVKAIRSLAKKGK